MSYAAAASKNRLPEDQQPHPDQSLLEGEHRENRDVPHSADEKVNTVSREDFDSEQSSLSADAPAFEPKGFTDADAPEFASAVDQLPSNQSGDAQKEKDEVAAKAQKDAAAVKQKAGEAGDAVQKKYNEVKKDVSKDVDAAKQKAGEVGDEAEKKAGEAKKEIGKDVDAAKQKASEVGNAAEKKANEVGDAAEKKAGEVKREAGKDYEAAKQKAGEYGRAAERKFEEGKEEAKKEYDELSEKARGAYNKLSREAQDDWHKLSAESKKQWEAAKNSDAGRELQKPEVWGSMLGITNVVVLGSLAYFTYANWHKPRWDRKVVSATVIGISTWFGLQGYLLPQTEAVKQRRQ